MKINKLNYEAFALEYLEGTLAVEEMDAMEQFLQKHPAIKAELEEMKGFVVLTPESIIFKNKKQLLREVSKDRVVWLNPLRWSVAASILLAVTILFFSKTTTIDPSIATVTPREVIDNNPTEIVLPRETVIEQEEVAIENQVRSEVVSQDAVAANENPKQQSYKTSTKKKEEIVYPIIADELQRVVTTIKSSSVAHEEEEKGQFAITKVSPNETVANVSDISEGIQRVSEPTPFVQPANETIQIATLTARDVVLLEVPKEIEGNAVNHISQRMNTAIANTPERRTLKSFIGKLPGNGVKVSLIPSFFTD